MRSFSSLFLSSSVLSTPQILKEHTEVGLAEKSKPAAGAERSRKLWRYINENKL